MKNNLPGFFTMWNDVTGRVSGVASGWEPERGAQESQGVDWGEGARRP